MTGAVSAIVDANAVRSLLETEKTLAAASSIEDTFATIAREASHTVACDAVYVLDYWPKTLSFRIASAWPLERYRSGFEIEADEGLVGFAVKNGYDVFTIENYSEFSYRGRDFAEFGPVASVVLREADGSEAAGLTIARIKGSAPFSEEEILTIQLFSSIASLALMKARQYQNYLDLENDNKRHKAHSAELLASAQHKLYQKEKELLALTERTGEITKTERVRISQSLHDSVKQSIVGVIRTLEAAERVMPQDADASRAHVDKALEFLRQIDADVRAAIHDLRPQELDSSGLFPSLERYCNNFVFQTRIECDCRCNGQPQPLSNQAEKVLFYVLSEALQNVAIHSGASKVVVLLNYTNKSVRLSIEDNGRGFDVLDPQQSGTPSGLGLSGIRRRVEELGGFAVVDSTRGSGTRINVRIPLC